MIYCFDSTKLDYLPITYAPKAVTINGAFTAMPNLTTADFEAPLATTANGLFYDCSGLQTVNVTLPKVENVGGMFAGCTSLTSLTVDFPYATTWYDKVWELDNYQGFCEGCTSLVSFSTPSEKTRYAYTGTLERMFYNCSKLVTADLSQINKWYGDYMTYASDASDYTDMFTGCTSLTTLTLAQDFGGFEYRGSSYATTVKPTLDLSSCPLTHDSCLDVFNKLGTRSNKNSTGTAYNSYVTGTLKLKATTYNLMTADEIAIATAKNWTVTSA